METEVSTVPRVESGYDMAPVAAAGGVAALVIALLLVGGAGVVANALEPAAAQAAPVTVAGGRTPTDGPGTRTAGPTAPPERVSAPTPAEPADTVRYIQWGDTLTQISRETGVSVSRLAEYNRIPQVDLIYADSSLRVPYLRIPAQGPADGAGK